MAYLRERRDGRVEIRESLATPAGPRARTLAIFRGALTPDVLDRARTRARGGLDARRLVARAVALGIAVSERRRSAAARALLEELARGIEPSPLLVTLLCRALAARPSVPIPDGLEDAAEWVARGPEERGRALRGLLRASDRIVRRRPRRRQPVARRFPRFRSRARRPRRART
jgi:hypothetical protein